MAAKIKTVSRKYSHRPPHKPKGVSDKAFKKVYWPYIPVILIIGVLLTMSSQAGAFSSMFNSARGHVLAYATSMTTGGLLSSTNAARASNGVKSLKTNSKLQAAAQAKASDMAKRNYWSHYTPDGKSPWTFVVAQGYSYQKLGENLAAGFSDEQATIDGWMASAPHRENLLDKDFTEVGFGYANNPNYTSAGGGPMTIVVAFYGKPQVLAAETTKKASSPPPAASTASPPPASTTPKKKTSKPKTVAPANTAKPQQAQAAPNTDTNVQTAELAAPSSRAQLVLASFPMAKFATTFALIGAASAIALWLSRHALAVRRAVLSSERFAIRHPLLDIGLLIIAALSFLLTQTAGFIQ
ncbi:MAG TPA: CAP domain-containing protein [Candidatus Saccharimonadales bacterium]|nr:CAP domain-containing protein [Candidatus Saccharimonadales bacterium]